jgi:hypothetical protein
MALSDNPHAVYMRNWRKQQRRTPEHRAEERAQSTTIGAPLQQPAVHVKLKNKAPAHGLKIAVVTDVQVKPGVPINHLRAAGRYIAEKRPDVIVCIGDFADMRSLNRHEDPASLGMQGQNYRLDIEATHRGMDELMEPIAKAKGYSPDLEFTLGNHEDLITRAVNADPRRLQGVYDLAHLRYEQYGWRVHPFLQPIVIGGVAFCHYFPGGVMGKPISSPSILLKKLHMSAFAGHQQGRDISYAKRADGKDLTAIISGSFYQHQESYLSPFTNKHWRGMYFLHEVKDGSFDEMALSLNYLLRRYGK